MVIHDLRNPTESIYHGMLNAKKRLGKEMQYVTDQTLKFFEEVGYGPLVADALEEEKYSEEVKEPVREVYFQSDIDSMNQS
jgi:hypothetical protein